MYIELDSVFDREGASIGIDYAFPLEDEVIASPVKVKGSVFNKTGVVRLEAEAYYKCDTRCARCNKKISFDVKVPVEHILLNHTANEDNDMFIVVDNMRLELDDLISEDVFLALPSRFLCNENCRGLCPVCGADLNRGECNCSKPSDPRWDALKDLFN